MLYFIHGSKSFAISHLQLPYKHIRLLSVATSSINSSDPDPLAATYIPMPENPTPPPPCQTDDVECFGSWALPFPSSYSSKIILVSSVRRTVPEPGRIFFFLLKRILPSLTSAWDKLSSFLYSWRHLLIVDFDKDMLTSQSALLTWLEAFSSTRKEFCYHTFLVFCHLPCIFNVAELTSKVPNCWFDQF